MAGRHGAAGLSGIPSHPPPAAAVAWRYWQVPVPAAPVLTSVSHRWSRWLPGAPVRATCIGGRHRAPAQGCGCGIYGTDDLATLKDHGLCLVPGAVVVGEVWLWGRTVREGREVRAEYGVPKRLWLVTETVGGPERAALVRRLEEAYGVPVGEMGADEALGEITATLMANQVMARAASTTTAPTGGSAGDDG